LKIVFPSLSLSFSFLVWRTSFSLLSLSPSRCYCRQNSSSKHYCHLFFSYSLDACMRCLMVWMIKIYSYWRNRHARWDVQTPVY
jgi:hypothetical protein